jgi:hypothetical protein
MPQSSPQPPKQRRRPSPTRLLKSAVAAGLSIRGIELDPITGKYTVLIGEPVPAETEGAGADELPRQG